MSVDKRAYLNEVMNLQFYGVVAKELITRKDLDIYCKYIFMYIVAEGPGWLSSRNNLAKNIGIHKMTASKYIMMLAAKNILTVKSGRAGSWSFVVNPPSVWAADNPSEWPTEETGTNLVQPMPQKLGGTHHDTSLVYTTDPILKELKEELKEYSPLGVVEATGCTTSAPQRIGQQIVDYWNEHVESPKIKSLSTSRIAKLKKRMSEKSFAENWQQIIDEIASNKFLSGDNERKWKADFAWMIENDSNYLKVLEGRYGSSSSKKLVDW